MSLRSRVTNVYAAEAVQLLSCMRRTGTAFSVPHGNDNWICKRSGTSFLLIGRMVQTITNPTLGSTTSCVLTPPRARSLAPKVNATSRVPTDLLLTTSIVPAFYPILCLLEPPFGTIPLVVPDGLVKSSNPPTSSDATSYDSSTTQALPWSTSQNPPIIRRSTLPVAPGASKHTAVPTRFKASYMVYRLAFHAPPRRRNHHDRPSSSDEDDYVRAQDKKTRDQDDYAASGTTIPETTAISTPKQRLCLQQDFISTVASLPGNSNCDAFVV